MLEAMEGTPVIDIKLRRALLGVGLGLLLGVLAAQADEARKPMIVKIHADWCGTCTRLESTMASLEEQVGSDAVIVVLDVTDRPAVEQSRARAQALGIEDFFDTYKAKTGTVGVLSADGKAIEVLNGETDTAPYRAALEKAKGA
jgi:thiol-disulfide isomerase/thioredoxin